jgi:hypothetical protein
MPQDCNNYFSHSGIDNTYKWLGQLGSLKRGLPQERATAAPQE